MGDSPVSDEGGLNARRRVLFTPFFLLVCWTVLPTVLSYCWGFQEYFQDWASARNWWEGISVYSPHSETLKRYLGQDSFSWPDNKLAPISASLKVNAHPPSSVLFYLPFALLPYGISFVIWNLFSTACLGLAVGIIASELKVTFSPAVVFGLGLMGLCAPLFEQMFLGQANAVTLILIVLAWRAHRNEMHTWEGVWLGGAVAFKLFPLALLLIPLGVRRWRTITTAALTMGFFYLLSISLFGLRIWKEYTDTGFAEAVAWGDLWLNASLSGFWRKLFVSQNKGLAIDWKSPLAFWCGYVASSALLTISTLALIIRDSKVTKGDISYAAGICAMLLLSPTCWPHYFVLLLLPLVVLWRNLDGHPWGRWMLVGCGSVLWLPSNYYCANPDWVTSVASPIATLSALSLQTYALGGVWGLAVGQGIRALRMQEPIPYQSKVTVPAAQVAA
jgi:hypothetical protein